METKIQHVKINTIDKHALLHVIDRAVSTPPSPAILHRGSNLIMFSVTDTNGYQQSCATYIEVKGLSTQNHSILKI